MTPNQASKLRALIKKLTAAEVADSWKGGGDPQEIPAIEADLHAAKTGLETFIRKLTECEQ